MPRTLLLTLLARMYSVVRRAVVALRRPVDLATPVLRVAFAEVIAIGSPLLKIDSADSILFGLVGLRTASYVSLKSNDELCT